MMEKVTKNVKVDLSAVEAYFADGCDNDNFMNEFETGDWFYLSDNVECTVLYNYRDADGEVPENEKYCELEVLALVGVFSVLCKVTLKANGDLDNVELLNLEQEKPVTVKL